MQQRSLVEWLAALSQLYLPRLATGGLIVLLGLGAAVIVKKVVAFLLRRAAPEVQGFVSRVAYVGIVIGAVVWALTTWRVPMVPFATLVGAFGLAVSLALQDTAKNFVAGLYLLIERPLRMGDVITIRSLTGRVELIGLRMTTLRGTDETLIMVPNTIIMSEIVTKRGGQSLAKDWPG
jgi:small-conductance mechanosensitive channel